MSAPDKKKVKRGNRAGADLSPEFAELLVRRLIAWRKAAGLTHEDAARKIGMSTSWIEVMEKSVNVTPSKPRPKARPPKLLAAAKLCRAYGRTLDDLMRGFLDEDDPSDHSDASRSH